MKRKKHFRQILLSFLFFFGLTTSHIHATDGYFALGYGAISKGVAGVGVSYYHYSLIGGNPAGNVFLGKKITFGIALFIPLRQYTISGNPSGLPGTFGLIPGTVDSDSKVFSIPNFGINWIFNEKNSFSIALYGNGGMNTDYPTQTFFDQSIKTTGVNLAQIFTTFSYSRKLGEKHSIGVSAILAFQIFKAEGLTNFGPFSSDATKLTNNGTDNAFGGGFKIGYMGEIVEGLHIGATYQTKVYMGKFSDYAGLFAEQGDFDVPSTWTAGIAYDVSDKLTFMFDVKQIFYSDINSVGNAIDPRALPPAFMNPDGSFTPNPNHVGLGEDNGSGFGWDDMTIIKFGLVVKPNDDWTFRGGYSYGKQPIPASEVVFNILAPGVIENHLALGFSRRLGDSHKTLNFSFNYAFNKSVQGFNPFDFDPVQAQQGVFVPNQTIKLEMHQFDFEVGFSF